MSRNYYVRYSPSPRSREELFQHVLTCLYRLDKNTSLEERWCSELNFSRGKWDGEAPTAFATYAEALTAARDWQGMRIWFYCNGGDLPLTILTSANERDLSVILMESSMPYAEQCVDQDANSRWRTFLLDVATAIDADFYLMECEPEYETISKEEFIRLLFAPAFRNATNLPIVTAFHERLMPNFPGKLVVPDCHCSHQLGSYMEIVEKDFEPQQRTKD